MLHLLLTLALALPGTPQEPAPEPPTEAVVAEAVEALQGAFKKGETPERLEALANHGAVNDARVVGCIAKGLKDKEPAVQLAAVEALRWLEHPGALAELHKAFKKDKKIKKNDALYEAFVWAIGQHGSPSSIDVLLDGAFAKASRKVQVARIYSLGHIRAKASVEELVGLLEKTGRRGGGQPMLQEITTSLRVLTGEDLGRDERAWTEWWRANEKDFDASPEPQGLPKRIAKAWEKRWSKPEQAKDEDPDQPRRKKRDRG